MQDFANALFKEVMDWREEELEAEAELEKANEYAESEKSDAQLKLHLVETVTNDRLGKIHPDMQVIISYIDESVHFMLIRYGRDGWTESLECSIDVFTIEWLLDLVEKQINDHEE